MKEGNINEKEIKERKQVPRRKERIYKKKNPPEEIP